MLETVDCALCGASDSACIARGRDYEYETMDNDFTFVECKSCGHVYLNPRPRLERAEVIYPKSYYTLSGKTGVLADTLQHLKNWVLYRRIKPVLRELPKGSGWLEVGAGDGSLSIVAKRHRPDLQAAVLDLNFSPECKSILGKYRIDVIESSLEHAVLSQRFHFIVMNQLIEHLWDLKSSLETIRNALAPAGIVSISTPDLNGYDRRYFASGTWGGHYIPRHLNLFTVHTLRCLLRDTGFTVERQRSLVAPMVWMRNCFNYLKRRNNPLYHVFRDENLPLMALFTLLDLAAIALGKPTSNLQVIASRSSETRGS